MSENAAPLVGSEYADPKFWASVAAIIVSLAWNYYNTRRNIALDAATKRNTEAIRFESVHGAAINSALDELRECVILIRNVRHTCKSVDEVANSLSKDLRSKLLAVQHSFAMDFKPISEERSLSHQPDEWRALALFDWDEIIVLYDAARNAASVSICSETLNTLLSAVENVRGRLLKLRVYENGSKG